MSRNIAWRAHHQKRRQKKKTYGRLAIVAGSDGGWARQSRHKHRIAWHVVARDRRHGVTMNGGERCVTNGVVTLLK